MRRMGVAAALVFASAGCQLLLDVRPDDVPRDGGSADVSTDGSADAHTEPSGDAATGTDGGVAPPCPIGAYCTGFEATLAADGWQVRSAHYAAADNKPLTPTTASVAHGVGEPPSLHSLEVLVPSEPEVTEAYALHPLAIPVPCRATFDVYVDTPLEASDAFAAPALASLRFANERTVDLALHQGSVILRTYDPTANSPNALLGTFGALTPRAWHRIAIHVDPARAWVALDDGPEVGADAFRTTVVGAGATLLGLALGVDYVQAPQAGGPMLERFDNLVVTPL